MTIGLMQYVMGRKHLQPAIERLAGSDARHARERLKVAPSASPARRRTFGGFTVVEWKRLAAMAVFFVFAAVFWGAYEQAGSSLNLFGDRYTRTSILGFSFPSSWFLTVQAIFVIVLAPAFAWLWIAARKTRAVHAGQVRVRAVVHRISFLFLLIPADAAAGHRPECA